ncbi:hypothetical protein HmCmsJML135_00539 [Escherichia coli]|nr:hypothetical protein HmCmsJML135_00539 [Escherichia coli]
MRLASRFGYTNQIRRDRPLTHEELMHYVPSIFGEDRHTSRSKRYAYIPTITVLESLRIFMKGDHSITSIEIG